MGDRHASGTFTGYSAEYKDRDGKWHPIEMTLINYPTGARVDGIPFPLINGGFLVEAWLMGKAQANALAYSYAANCEATRGSPVEVRIVPHEVKYTLDVNRVEAD